jgi:hypothetical protein
MIPHGNMWHVLKDYIAMRSWSFSMCQKANLNLSHVEQIIGNYYSPKFELSDVEYMLEDGTYNNNLVKHIGRHLF